MKKFLLVLGVIAVLFSSCISTNKSFQSSPVVSQHVTLDPIKADVKIDEKKITGSGSVSYFLIFRVSGENSFADGITYSADMNSQGLKKIGSSLGFGIMNQIRSAAAYNALQAGNYDLLVHPTYQTKQENYLWIFRRYSVTVSGYGATYSNFRTVPQTTIILPNGNVIQSDKSNTKVTQE